MSASTLGGQSNDVTRPQAFDLDSGKCGVCCFSLSSALTIDLLSLEFRVMLKSIKLSIY